MITISISITFIFYLFTGRASRIDAILAKAGLTTEEEKKKYKEALEYSSSGYTIIMARDIDELWVNSYNPEITRAWNGNTDFQICLDFYAIITYITEYFTKDDSGVVKILVNTLKASDCEDLKDKMKLLMNTWIKNRQMGEAEAVYRLTKEFHFRDSDTACVFVQSCPRSERSKILKNVTDKPEYNHMPKVKVENLQDIEFIEQYDNHSKYERRPKDIIQALNKLSYSHMVKMFRPFWGKGSKKEKDLLVQKEFGKKKVKQGFQEDSLSEDEENEMEFSDQKFNHVMAFPWEEGKGPLLPQVFKLHDPFPGEPPFMKLRRMPAVLRFHKYKVEKDPDAYWFSEAMLYMPHDNEEDLAFYKLRRLNQMDQMLGRNL